MVLQKIPWSSWYISKIIMIMKDLFHQTSVVLLFCIRLNLSLSLSVLRFENHRSQEIHGERPARKRERERKNTERTFNFNGNETVRNN